MKTLYAVAAALALLIPPSAAAKEFSPGDLRLCGADECAVIAEREALRLLSRFYYSIEEAPRARTDPRLGAPYLQLKFRNGYVTGIVATASFDRFLSYGVHLGRFRRGIWYRVPPAAAEELRRLARELEPLRLTRTAIARSR
jgi:hypothetical protein